jgi:hypothetical protein
MGGFLITACFLDPVMQAKICSRLRNCHKSENPNSFR